MLFIYSVYICIPSVLVLFDIFKYIYVILSIFELSVLMELDLSPCPLEIGSYHMLYFPVYLENCDKSHTTFLVNTVKFTCTNVIYHLHITLF